MNLADRMWMERYNAEERNRRAAYSRAWDAYFGRLPKPLQLKPGQADDNVQVNLARLAVNASVSFLFGQDVGFDLDAQAQKRTPAEQWLDACWTANRKAELLIKLGINGGVCGHVFVKIVGGQLYPRLINLSPEYVSVVTDPDDIDTVLRYLIEYPAVGSQGERLTIRQVIERQGAGERWEITDQIARNDGAFQTRSQVIWPWAWCPIVDCQNLPSPNEFYGVADLETDIVDLNASINFALSNTQRIIRFHAHPKTWGKGFRASEMKLSADAVTVLESPEAQLANLEMQSDLESSLAFYHDLKEAFHQVSQTPEIAVGHVEGVTDLSGVALRILYGPLLALTNLKRLSYGSLLQRINQRLLEMGGFGPQNVTTLAWADPVPVNQIEQRNVALLDHQLGVSQDTLLTQLGYDPGAEIEKRSQEQAGLGEQLLTAFDRGQEAL